MIGFNKQGVSLPHTLSCVIVAACLLTTMIVPAITAVGQTASTSTTATKVKSGVIKGIVVEAGGEPIPGATVILKGTKTGVMTDADGNFTLPVKGQAKEFTITVSSVGMEPVTLKASVGKPVKVELKSNNMLQELVVETGYSTLPRKDMVGAYTTVKAEDVMMPAMTSIDQMLQGKISGMVVTNSSTRVGAKPSITIRGTSTIMGNTDPLWVVDGIIQSDPLSIDASSALTEDMRNVITNQISWLNPQDIETITVLKDASATAIYGSKASNGVIVITTKKGSAERTSVSYTGNVSVRMRPNYKMFNYMNSKERIQFSKEAYEAGARYQEEPIAQPYSYEGLMAMYNKHMISESEFARNLEFLETGNTDWFDLLLRNSVSTSHNVSVSGGTKKVTYNASVGYNLTNGTERGNDQSRLTTRLVVNSQISNRVRLSFSVNGTNSDSKSFGPNVSPQSYAQNTSRAVPAYDMNGKPVYYDSYYTYSMNMRDIGSLRSGYNIFNEIENSYSKNKSSSYNFSLNLDVKIFDWLTYQLVGNMGVSSNTTDVYDGETTNYIEQNYRGYPAGTEKSGSEKFNAALMPFGGMLRINNSRSTSYDMQHKFVFQKTFNDIHRINAMAAMQMRSVASKSSSSTMFGYEPDRGEIMVSPTYPNNIQPIGRDNSSIQWGALDYLYDAGGLRSYNYTSNYLSYFATLAYSLKDTYVFNANVRQDASNRFGQDTNHRFNPTYSFGFNWRMGEMGFVRNHLTWLNQLNLRATYGIQGNVVQSVSPDLIASYGGILGGYNEFYTTISSLPNPYLKWESTRSWNFGLDLQFLKGVTLNLEYYGRRSNVIVSQPIPEEYGMKNMPLNGGIIYNEGVEVTLNFTPFHTKDFAWTIGINASKNWNRVGNNEDLVRADETSKSDYLAGSSNRMLRAGYPLSSFWSYSFAGLDPKTGYPTFNKIDGSDPSVNTDPLTFLVYSGQTTPYFTGGINTRIRWKEFSISANFSALLGAKKRLPNPYNLFNNGKLPSPYSQLSRQLNDRWKQPGDEAHTNIPALYTSVISNDINLALPDGSIANNRYSMWAYSDARVADASFFRCSQLSLTYYLPKKICNKFRAQNCSFSANVNNLFVIASKKWNGFDPELGESVQPKIFSFGLNISF